MNKYPLSNLSLQEIEIDESKEINGGLFGFEDILIGAAVGVIVEVISDWDNFKAGLMGQPPVEC